MAGLGIAALWCRLDMLNFNPSWFVYGVVWMR